MSWRIDIESAAGAIVGSGPITNATGWTSTARMDRGGSFQFGMSASDDKADLVQPGRIARCYALVGGTWQEIGAGVIDRITRRVSEDGAIELTVEGGDLLASLGYRSMQNYGYGVGGTPATLADIATDLETNWLSGWTVDVEGTPTVDGFYGKFSYDTILAALRMITERSQTHFYYSGPQAITITEDWSDSGVRAVQARGDVAAGTCAITQLSEIEDSFDLCNLLYAFGGGNGDARLTLRSTTLSAQPEFGITNGLIGDGTTVFGYSSYMTDTGSILTYGVRSKAVQWKDIYPLSSTDADVEAAGNALFYQSVRYLRQHSEPQRFYSVAVAGCDRLLRPMQTIRIAYRDAAGGLDIDEDLYILEATTECNADGPTTVALVVATTDRFPDTDISAITSSVASGQIYQAHPQTDHNGYVISYTKSLDDAETAVFRFRFDEEVLRLIRCTFDFQLLPLESTVKSVASSAATTAAGGSSTPTSSSGGSSTPTTSSGGATTSSGGGSSTPTTSSGGSSTPTTDSGSGHTHEINLANSTSGSAVYFAGTGSPPTGDFRTSGGGKVNTSSTGSGHTHSVTIAAHTHTVTIGTHTHTIGDHTHSVTITAHTHSVTIGDHTHDYTPTITANYGIFRDTAGNTFGLTDLEYSIDGSTWYAFAVGVNGFTTLGDGWYRVDLTALLYDSTTYRPLASNNALQIRRKSTGAIKKATIDAQMNIRTQIQSLALT